ncbi:uncharacterized protein LOC119546287 [Drosophila subpulchrella]|uniref:uncharacterized protein LOC119546287 n=1 Tax=Drosophila subpulchrella TaxID=1486046 RepID=UPI0018A1B3E1|nr:uncharacterized protein LOC119546287 [Drosophila subpulchrella]
MGDGGSTPNLLVLSAASADAAATGDRRRWRRRRLSLAAPLSFFFLARLAIRFRLADLPLSLKSSCDASRTLRFRVRHRYRCPISDCRGKQRAPRESLRHLQSQRISCTCHAAQVEVDRSEHCLQTKHLIM